jgi:hypothetical protein
MTTEMPDEVNAAYRGEFAGFAHYCWGFVGSHRTSISENHIRNTETRGTSARGKRRNVRCLPENYHKRGFTVLLVSEDKRAVAAYRSCCRNFIRESAELIAVRISSAAPFI